MADVKVSIDGKEVSLPAGSTIMQAARKEGVFIPHFCYHPGLKIVGQCRMCFVEVEGRPKLVTACSEPVAEGMKILTDTPKVKEGQNSTLEFTLLHHPLDCPICDRGGECKLQDFTYDYGPPRSRMDDEKTLKDKHRAISQQIVLDQERCILCTRCTRFSADVDGRNELVVNERAHYSVIDVFDGRPLQSKFSGNVVDLCPVGALTARDFRFQARPWELKKHEAICSGCAVGCNVEIDTKHRKPSIPRPDGRPAMPEIMRVMPRENLAVNQYWLCDKGRWGYHFHNDEDKRFHGPQLRSGAVLQPSSLHDVQVALGTHKDWEFWVDDTLPHEGIAWVKELAESWQKRGRKLSINSSILGQELLTWWASRSASPWTAGAAEWGDVKVVVSTLKDYRALEDVAPILALRLGQEIRAGRMQWQQRTLAQFHDAKDDAGTTAYLAPVPQSSSDIKNLGKVPAAAKLLVLWTSCNARGLLNEGLAPIECVAGELKDKKASGAAFYFGQRTQNPPSAELVNYLRGVKALFVADSYASALSEKAQGILPLQPLYESRATLTNLENRQQLSLGVHIHHPNYASIQRGGELVSASLRLL